jgi:hypothetical protein
VDVGIVADILELCSASVIRVEVCKVGEFLYMYRFMFLKEMWKGRVGLMPYLCQWVQWIRTGVQLARLRVA